MTNKRKTRKRGGAPPNTNENFQNINKDIMKEIKEIEARVT